MTELNEQFRRVIQDRQAIEDADCFCEQERSRLLAALEAIPYPTSSLATLPGIRSYRKPLFAEYRLAEVDQSGNRVIYSARQTRFRFEFDHDADCWRLISSGPDP